MKNGTNLESNYPLKLLSLILRYLRHLFLLTLSIKKKPPLIKNLIENVIKANKTYYAFNNIETIRDEFLRNEQTIIVNDFGFGSEEYSKERKIKDISKKSSVPPKYGQLLFKLVNHFEPKIILELGTSFGISTMYLASARKQAEVMTLEGCTERAKIAQQVFRRLNLDNIKLILGNFDETLPKILQKINNLGFVFFDGNHKESPTINYFEQCLKKADEHSVFIFDDINWSKEMEKAWKYIKKHPKVSATIETFSLGIVFFYSHLVEKKQHYYILY